MKAIGKISMKGCVVLIIALTAGCGGGGGGGSQAVAATTVTPNPVVIEAYGDSTTQGWEQPAGTAGYVTPLNVPAQLQTKLQAQYGSTVTVVQQGVGGTEASQLLNGTDGTHASTWAQLMAVSPAKIVTLNFSLNDAYFSRVARAGTIPESPEQYAAYMTQLVQIAKAAGKNVVLMEPNPTCEPIRQAAMPPYVEQLRAVANAQGVPLVAHFDAIQAMSNWQSMLTDCLHPDDALYTIKANQEFTVLSPLVKSLQ